MGFVVREEEYFSKTFYHPLDDVEVEVCVSDPEHLNKFPFDKWQLPKPNDNVDPTRQDIREANEEYWYLHVIPVFQMRFSSRKSVRTLKKSCILEDMVQ